MKMISLEFTALQAPRVEIENSRQTVGVVHLWWGLLRPFTLPTLLAPGLGATFSHATLSFTFETFTTLVASIVSLLTFARSVVGRWPVAWGDVPSAGASIGARVPTGRMAAAR